MLVYFEFGMIALAQSGNPFLMPDQKMIFLAKQFDLGVVHGTNTTPCRRCKSILVLISTKVINRHAET